MGDNGPGRREELELLYQRHGAMVIRRALRMLGDGQAARDVCHDVFVQILVADSWPPPSPVAWLYVTTTNRCLNMLRSERRRRVAVSRLSLPEAFGPPTEAALLLQRVPPELQDIAIYFSVDQMSQDEIATVLGVSQKTVSNRIRALRESLDPPEPTVIKEMVK